MGWTEIQSEKNSFGLPEQLVGRPPDYESYTVAKATGKLVPVFNYSTEIKDAWKIVEKLREVEAAVEVWGNSPALKHPEPWRCRVHRSAMTLFEGRAKTAAHAICLAALGAVEEIEKVPGVIGPVITCRSLH